MSATERPFGAGYFDLADPSPGASMLAKRTCSPATTIVCRR
jgi:hypothetical protein